MTEHSYLRLLSEPTNPGVLCSANSDGEVNAAIFGSAHLVDGNSLVIGLGDNLTLENLKVNPKATYIFFTPGQTLFSWQGARLYLETIRFEASGPLFDNTVAITHEKAGAMAASQLTTAVVFKITRIRPLIDMDFQSTR